MAIVNALTRSGARVRGVVVCSDKSRTLQSEKNDADINVIVKRFGVTNTLPILTKFPTFQEFRDVFDFQSAANVIRSAVLSFERLPAEVRKRFGNSPQEFLTFMGKEDNIEEKRKLGLVPKEPEPPKKAEPMEVRVVEDKRSDEVVKK